MPIFSDAVGNYCIGGTFSPATEWNEIVNNLSSVLTSALGSTDRFITSGFTTQSGSSSLPSSPRIEWRPNMGAETLTGAMSTGTLTSNAAINNANARFKSVLTATSGSAANVHLTRTGVSTFVVNTAATLIDGFTYDTTRVWLTANSRSISLFYFTNTTKYRFFSLGILQNPRSYISSLYPLYAYDLFWQTGSGASPTLRVQRPFQVGTATAQAFLSSGNANYSIACVNPADTASSVVTDLWLRDNNSASNDPAAGKAPNLYLAKGLYTVGSIYKFDEDVDGSALRHIVCCGAFGSDFIMMRIGD